MCDGSCSHIGGSHYPYQCSECDAQDARDKELEKVREEQTELLILTRENNRMLKELLGRK